MLRKYFKHDHYEIEQLILNTSTFSIIPQCAEMELNFIIPFATIYLCEVGFSALEIVELSRGIVCVLVMKCVLRCP